MSHAKTENDLSYAWWKADSVNRIKIEIGENAGVPDENSHGEFIVEHYWGYTKRGANCTDEYKVEHPKWELFGVKNYEIQCNFEGFTASSSLFWRTKTPYSIFMAKGSPVAVYKGAKLVL
jgi:hypothetical protein